MPIFKSDFHVMISNIKIPENNDFKSVPDKIKEVAPPCTLMWSKLYLFTSVLQLGFEGRGAPGRALFAWSYKNEGIMCHAMCLLSRHVTKYNPIPQ